MPWPPEWQDPSRAAANATKAPSKAANATPPAVRSPAADAAPAVGEVRAFTGDASDGCPFAGGGMRHHEADGELLEADPLMYPMIALQGEGQPLTMPP